MSNPHETWSKWLPHEAITLPKFHVNGTKIVDFLSMANFWMCVDFFYSDLSTYKCHIAFHHLFSSRGSVSAVLSEMKSSYVSSILKSHFHACTLAVVCANTSRKYQKHKEKIWWWNSKGQSCCVSHHWENGYPNQFSRRSSTTDQNQIWLSKIWLNK